MSAVKPPSAKEAKALRERRQALSDHLRTRVDPADPATLARSYGLPQAEIERAIRSICK